MQPELQPIRTGGSLPAQDYAVQQHRVLRNTYWLLALSLIPTVIGAAVGTNLDLGFTLFMGLLLGPVLQFVLGLNNGIQLVMMAAGGTAAVFFGLAGLASSTTRDFGFLAKFLFVGFIVIMLAILANIFLASPILYLTLLGAIILFSSAVILFQINAIVRGGETNYVSATLSLYVSIWNIFSSLLQLLGIFGGNRD